MLTLEIVHAYVYGGECIYVRANDWVKIRQMRKQPWFEKWDMLQVYPIYTTRIQWWFTKKLETRTIGGMKYMCSLLLLVLMIEKLLFKNSCVRWPNIRPIRWVYTSDAVKRFAALSRASQIFTIILPISVCQCSQSAGRNSCSIVSVDVSNWSYRLTVHPVTSSRLSSS